MRYLVLARFHPRRGPEISLSVPTLENKYIQEQICKKLDFLEDPGFFSLQHVTEEKLWDTANLYFEVMDQTGRGGVQMGLLTLIITEEETRPNHFQLQLIKLSGELSKISFPWEHWHD